MMPAIQIAGLGNAQLSPKVETLLYRMKDDNSHWSPLYVVLLGKVGRLESVGVSFLGGWDSSK